MQQSPEEYGAICDIVQEHLDVCVEGSLSPLPLSLEVLKQPRRQIQKSYTAESTGSLSREFLTWLSTLGMLSLLETRPMQRASGSELRKASKPSH